MRTLSASQLLEHAADFFDVDLVDLKIDYLKVDCQGCEYEFLPKLSDHILNKKAFHAVVCETHPSFLNPALGFIKSCDPISYNESIVHPTNLTLDHDTAIKLRDEVQNLCLTNPWQAIVSGNWWQGWGSDAEKGAKHTKYC